MSKTRSVFTHIATAGFALASSLAMAQSNIIQIGEGAGGITGSGKVKSETRALPAFERIEIDSSTDLTIRRADKQTVKVTTDDNLLRIVKTEVRDKRLYVSTDGSYSTRVGMTIEIDLPLLTEIISKGSSDIDIQDLQTKQFQIHVSGSGDIRADGNADQIKIRNSGSSDLDLAQLKSKIVDIQLTGSGDAQLWATDELTVSISGSGDVVYKGSPKLIQAITGSGEVTRESD